MSTVTTASSASSRGNTRKAAKRALCPFINSGLVAVADTGDLGQLLEAVNTYLPDMNLVNLTTALHRVAKLSTPASPLFRLPLWFQVLGAMLASLRTNLARLETASSSRCQTLSNIMWSMATLQCADLELVAIVVRLTQKNLPTFQPFELASALWSLAKLGQESDIIHELAAPLFQQASGYIVSQVADYTPNYLVMVISGYTLAHHYDACVWRAVGPRLLQAVKRGQCHPPQVAEVAAAYCEEKTFDEEIFSAVVKRASKTFLAFEPQDLAKLSLAVAASGRARWDFFPDAVRALLSKPAQPRDIAGMIRAVASVRPRHAALLSSILALLPRCVEFSMTFQVEELMSIICSLAGYVNLRGSEVFSDSLMDLSPVAPDCGTILTFLEALLPLAVARLASLSDDAFVDAVKGISSLNSNGTLRGYARVITEVCREVQRRAPALRLQVLLGLITEFKGVESHEAEAIVQLLLQEVASRGFYKEDGWSLGRSLAASRGDSPATLHAGPPPGLGFSDLSTCAGDLGDHTPDQASSQGSECGPLLTPAGPPGVFSGKLQGSDIDKATDCDERGPKYVHIDGLPLLDYYQPVKVEIGRLDNAVHFFKM